jgi:hypothetical protein
VTLGQPSKRSASLSCRPSRLDPDPAPLLQNDSAGHSVPSGCGDPLPLQLGTVTIRKPGVSRIIDWGGTQDRGESIPEAARGSGEGCLPVQGACAGRSAHGQSAKAPTVRWGRSLPSVLGPWAHTVPVFLASIHPEWS